MVKRSKGCKTCRTRRLKCDEARPACAQCLKVHYACPGYPDDWTVMHRSENEQIARRVRAINSPKHIDGFSTTSSSVRKSACSRQDSLPMVSPSSPTIIDEAVAFFLHSYVLKHGEIANAHFTYQQMINYAKSSEAVFRGMGAVGMASLGNIRKSKALNLIATQEYASALKLTAVLLQDTTLCQSDETVFAVVLLGMFEFFMSTNLNINGWEKHINGATALLRLRGTEQIHQKSGLQLFTLLRSNIMANCLRAGTKVPTPVVELSKAAENLRPPGEKYADILVDIVSRLSKLRADIKSGRVTDWLKILDMTVEIDQSFSQWASDAPDRWRYTTSFYQIDNDPIHGNASKCMEYTFFGRFDTYPDLWATNVWNYYRATRMIISWMILNLLAHTPPETSSYLPGTIITLRRNAEENKIQLAEDICASVAFSFNPVSCQSIASGKKLPEPTYTPGGCLGGSLLIYPLDVAAWIPQPQSYLRTWMFSCLEHIAHDMGIGRADAVLRFLEESKNNGGDDYDFREMLLQN